ncbi:MAG: HD domain-containing protein, partial [Sarcina sp.]
MDKDIILKNTIEFIKERFEGKGSGHDWLHIDRVYRNAIYIMNYEEADKFIVKMSALLHDLDDWKFNKEVEGEMTITEKFLNSQNLNKEDTKKILEIIESISYKGGVVSSKQSSIEGMIVQDADRLDAMGAVGIARAFTYGGYKNNLIYDPKIKPQIFNNLNEVKKKNTTINHFYEKLLKLKDLMNTETAKTMANKRHKYMEDFLDTFYEEWNISK